ncbi:hypothetical protein F2P56_001062 [Juglans regia]|uniref:Uncharacterized protein n=1 Tax=Juglans regia TaxID=51240 RepID=A0A833Y9S6_JUGRE|nr:hypothetical protein F2P56_001062 [Juglans regia]
MFNQEKNTAKFYKKSSQFLPTQKEEKQMLSIPFLNKECENNFYSCLNGTMTGIDKERCFRMLHFQIWQQDDRSTVSEEEALADIETDIENFYLLVAQHFCIQFLPFSFSSKSL